MVVHGTDPYNAEPSPRTLADRTLTPLDAFYSRDHGPLPDLDPVPWRPTVDGPVERPLTPSLEDLRSDFSRVDVSLDEGGPWIQADLDEQGSPWAWQHWRTTADLGEGETVITARARDTAGATQPESARHLWNTPWARIRVTCRS